MAAPILNKKIEKALRIAIANGGLLSYNPDMYRLGNADNIPPSDSFNKELEKYGIIEYDYGMNNWNPFDSAWIGFTINEYGRKVDRERNGTLVLKRHPLVFSGETKRIKSNSMLGQYCSDIIIEEIFSFYPTLPVARKK